MLKLYKIVNYILEKLHFKIKKTSKKGVMIDVEELRRQREKMLQEKRELCDTLIQELSGVQRVTTLGEDSLEEIPEEVLEQCIQEIIRFRDSDSLKHIIHEEEVFDTYITDYFVYQGGKVSLTTNMYDMGIAAGHHTHYYEPADILSKYYLIVKYSKDNHEDQNKEKGMQ